ncbi:MAG: hypothetical protein Q9167_000346 [Letrouitia subvulpina]
MRNCPGRARPEHQINWFGPEDPFEQKVYHTIDLCARWRKERDLLLLLLLNKTSVYSRGFAAHRGPKKGPPVLEIGLRILPPNPAYRIGGIRHSTGAAQVAMR